MDLIDRQAALMLFAGDVAAQNELNNLPSAQPELQWHECFEDDPSSFPDDDRNVLVSFSNFSLSIIGQWRVDEDSSGCW